MILGVDHIALSCEDLNVGRDVLEKLGFQRKFQENHIPNPHQKSILLSSFRTIHGMAFFNGKTGPKIELTCHGHFPDLMGTNAYSVFLGNCPDNCDDEHKTSNVKAAFSGEECLRIELDSLKVSVYSTTTKKSGVQAMVVLSQDIEEALSFWQSACGFRMFTEGEDEKSRRWFQGTIKGMLPQWTVSCIILESSERPRKSMLDHPGFNCVGLLTSDIEKEIKCALSAGAKDSTGVFELTVNRQDLQLAMLRSPSGEIIEYIQIGKDRKDISSFRNL